MEGDLENCSFQSIVPKLTLLVPFRSFCLFDISLSLGKPFLRVLFVSHELKSDSFSAVFN